MIIPGEYSSIKMVVICCAECKDHDFLVCGDDVECDLRNGDYQWTKNASGKWVCLSCWSKLRKAAKEERG